MSVKWEPLLNNLGHVSRKLCKYDDALSYHQQALVLKPLSASTFSSIGYVYALKCELVEAIEAFHKALGIRRDDTFSTTMLNNVIEQMIHEEPAFSGESWWLVWETSREHLPRP
jgi:anaphase-promoting complex subunit 6